MCDPVTLMAAASAGASAGGSLFSGVSGYNSKMLSSSLAEGNADLLHTQSEIAKGGADLAVVRGNYDEFLSRRKVSHVLAGETAHYASGNVDPTYGSPLALQGFSAAQGETDAQLIRAHMMTERADALTRAANIQGQAAGQRYKAAADWSGAQSSMISGVIGAGTALLSAGSKWPGLSDGPAGGGFSGSWDNANPFFLQQPENI